MKTCPRFHRIKAQAERDIQTFTSHAEKYAGRPSATQSTTLAHLARQRMGRALSRHYENCLECG